MATFVRRGPGGPGPIKKTKPGFTEAGLCPKGAGRPQAAREGYDKFVASGGTGLQPRDQLNFRNRIPARHRSKSCYDPPPRWLPAARCGGPAGRNAGRNPGRSGSTRSQSNRIDPRRMFSRSHNVLWTKARNSSRLRMASRLSVMVSLVLNRFSEEVIHVEFSDPTVPSDVERYRSFAEGDLQRRLAGCLDRQTASQRSIRSKRNSGED